MKSLQESLFDKDNITKEVTVGDMYKLQSDLPSVNQRGGLRPFFALSERDWDTGKRTSKGRDFIINTLMEMPLPTKKDFTPRGTWCDDLKEKLKPEVLYYAKNIYDRQFLITLQDCGSSKFRVRFIAYPNIPTWPSKEPDFTEYTLIKK